MSNFFLQNSAIDIGNFELFKSGISNLIGIDKLKDHIFYKHESLYSLAILVEHLYTAKHDHEIQEIFRFLEQLTPCQKNILTEKDALEFCNSDINGFLGIDFSRLTIIDDKQIIGEESYMNWCYKFHNAPEDLIEEYQGKPSEKKIHLSDHHGKKELQDLCDRIKNSPYVVEMRSTDWGGKNFIRKIHHNGIIEIVLYKTNRQYALQVQTTGSNEQQTKLIAEILKERYDN